MIGVIMVQEFSQKLQTEIEKIFIGKQEQVRLIMASVFTGGHVLLDDLPGSGKTTLIKTLSAALGCGFQRVQFTPDLLPSDIIGMTIFDQKEGDFRQVKGPVFTNILLADEINRAIPRTQSALLEAMEERQVTLDRQTYALPDPFIVLATQNPVEEESTFRLPAAQKDRFFMSISLGFPDKAEESLMLENLGDGTDYRVVEPVGTPEDLIKIRKEISGVYVSEYMRNYIVDLTHATRDHAELKIGASPRGSRSLYQGAKAIAAMEGRGFVIPEDIQLIFIPVLAHRIQTERRTGAARRGADEILNEILATVPVPPGQQESIQ